MFNVSYFYKDANSERMLEMNDANEVLQSIIFLEMMLITRQEETTPTALLLKTIVRLSFGFDLHRTTFHSLLPVLLTILQRETRQREPRSSGPLRSALIKRRMHRIIRSIDAFMTPRRCLRNDVYHAGVCVRQLCRCVCLDDTIVCTAREALFVPARARHSCCLTGPVGDVHRPR